MDIQLLITDQSTGKDHVVSVSLHDAKKLYKALHELVGDIQYGAKPGELITLPQGQIRLGA